MTSRTESCIESKSKNAGAGERIHPAPTPRLRPRAQAPPRAPDPIAWRAVRIFSGIQPTGRKHLGNYIGAIEQYVAYQDRGEAIYCIVDLHATTVPYEPALLRERLYDTAALLLAAGLDPERCIFFRQGDVPEHTELTWLLSSVTAFGDLNRMHQFKEKAGAQRDLVSAGLFTYPILMAADVLAYRADQVPVGDDQRQHIELMRDIAERFNARFAPDADPPPLVVPEGVYREIGARIMDLQEPERKMSTTGGTEQGTVLVLDEPKTIERRFRRAVTDSGSEIRHTPEKPGISNLIEILAAVRGTDFAAVESDFADARYGDFKVAVAEAVIERLRSVQERYAELRPDEAALEAILVAGAEKAHAIAAPVVADVRALMGVGPNPRR
jgi:tryptophanyl-tRNA synthetase